MECENSVDDDTHFFASIPSDNSRQLLLMVDCTIESVSAAIPSTNSSSKTYR